MKSNNPPIDHHYIPQFLLDQWTVGGKLYRYTQPETHPVRGTVVSDHRPTRAVGFQQRLYEMSMLPSEDAQVIEQTLMKTIDDRAAIAHKMLLDKDQFYQLDSDQRSAWIVLIQSLTIRTPDNLAAYKAGFSATYNRLGPIVEVQAKYDEMKRPEDPPTYEEWMATNDPTAPEKAAFHMLPTAIQNEQIGQHIIQMKWSVLEIYSGSFLISDEPAIISNGIGKPDGHIAMPISPTKLFLATNNKQTYSQICAHQKELVRKVNQKVVGRAKYFVGARDTSQKRFIENRFGREPEESVTKLFAAQYVDEMPPANASLL
jgi:hypothetical protein